MARVESQQADLEENFDVVLTEVVIDRSFAFAIRDTHTGANPFLAIIDDPSE